MQYRQRKSVKRPVEEIIYWKLEEYFIDRCSSKLKIIKSFHE